MSRAARMAFAIGSFAALPDRKELRVDLPAADTLAPLAWVPARNAVFIRRVADDDADPEVEEFYLCDPETGQPERVEGEFRPWFHAQDHPLQPAGDPHEVWAALPGGEETRVGRYDTGTFAFRLAATYPRLSFTSDRMWVDAAQSNLYVAKHGDLLALPFSP